MIPPGVSLEAGYRRPVAVYSEKKCQRSPPTSAPIFFIFFGTTKSLHPLFWNPRRKHISISIKADLLLLLVLSPGLAQHKQLKHASCNREFSALASFWTVGLIPYSNDLKKINFVGLAVLVPKRWHRNENPCLTLDFRRSPKTWEVSFWPWVIGLNLHSHECDVVVVSRNTCFTSSILSFCQVMRLQNTRSPVVPF